MLERKLGTSCISSTKRASIGVAERPGRRSHTLGATEESCSESRFADSTVGARAMPQPLCTAQAGGSIDAQEASAAIGRAAPSFIRGVIVARHAVRGQTLRWVLQ